ncbi:MBA family surface membrane protein [Ureaplasma parvum]|uniref:MBA family surface membrane protein n=1 Tax=Ureaplasma parvum TaxID=134821 RepID=UPI00307F101E
MKLLKNKKFWAMSLSAIAISTSIVAFAASCSNTNIKSKLSKQLAQTKDQKNHFAVYEIENYTKLTDEEKKSLENLEFGVSILDKDGKNPINIKVKGVQKEGKIYVKLPRKPEVNEKLLVVPTKNILKTEALVLNNDNLNYQTVTFEQVPNQNSTPVPENPSTPESTKKDEVIANKITINKIQNGTATIEVTFSKFKLADANKKDFVLEVKDSANDDASAISATELVFDANKKILTGKLNGLASNINYKISKFTLNNNEIKFDFKQEDQQELLNQYIQQAELNTIIDKANKKINIKLQNFSILNSFQDNQPVLTFDIEINKKDGITQVVHKSLTKNQLLNPNGLEIDLKDKMKNNIDYDVKLTNVKIANIALNNDNVNNIEQNHISFRHLSTNDIKNSNDKVEAKFSIGLGFDISEKLKNIAFKKLDTNTNKLIDISDPTILRLTFYEYNKDQKVENNLAAPTDKTKISVVEIKNHN